MCFRTADSRTYNVCRWSGSPEFEAKPEKWTLLDLHAETRGGDILVLEGFWTGAAWRIIGNKHGFKNLRVTTWKHKAEGS
jgi:hypothetical protein